MKISKRQLQFGELVRHALADILLTERLDEVALQGLVITISSVMMSPDLKNARVFFVAQRQEQNSEVVQALNRAVPFFKKILAKKLRARFVPHLRFLADDSFQVAEEIEALLHHLRR